MNQAALKKLAEAQAAGGGPKLATDSRYALEVLAIKYRDGFKGESMIAELKVLEAEPVVPGAKPSAAGTAVDVVENLSKKDSNGAGRFKTFLMRLVGETDESKCTIEWMAKFFDQRQAGVGRYIAAETYTDEIRGGENKGKPITKIRWTNVPLDAETAKAIDAKRAGMKLPSLAEALK